MKNKYIIQVLIISAITFGFVNTILANDQDDQDSIYSAPGGTILPIDGVWEAESYDFLIITASGAPPTKDTVIQATGSTRFRLVRGCIYELEDTTTNYGAMIAKNLHTVSGDYRGRCNTPSQVKKLMPFYDAYDVIFAELPNRAAQIFFCKMF